MPLKQFSSALVLAVLLAGCSSNGDGPSTEGASVATGSASAPAATPAADGRCDANAVQAYVGKQASRPSSRRPAAPPERKSPGRCARTMR